jgi:predicted permease
MALNQAIRFGFPLMVMASALTIGYLMRIRTGGCLPLSKRLTRLGLIWLDPVNIVLALWGQSFADRRVLLLPAIGMVLTCLPAVLMAAVARRRRMEPARAGALVATSMFSNQGPTFGTFLAFVLAGEAGFALASMYTLFFYPLFFTVGLLVGRSYAAGKQVSTWRVLVDNLRDPAGRNCLLAVPVGILLSVLGTARPAGSAALLDFLVPVTTLVYLAGIGMTLDFSQVRGGLRGSYAIGALKFALGPALALLAIALLRGLGLTEPLWDRVILIQNCMPAAIFALVLVNLFDLDRDLANTIWLATNGAGIILSPLILIAARAL